MNDYENAILEQQESVSEDCATCEYKCNCCSQCMEIAEIKAMSKQYEETRKQLLKNVETINALMGR